VEVKMPRYIVYKKIHQKSGHIYREVYLDKQAKGVNELIHSNSQAGLFTHGDYVAFRVLKNGKIAKAGKPFTI
jgi:hypothetical protein